MIWLRADADARLGAGHLVRMVELQRRLGPLARLLVKRDLLATCIAAQAAVDWFDAGKVPLPDLHADDTVVFDVKHLPAAAVQAVRAAGARAVVIEDDGSAGRKADLLVDCNRLPDEAENPQREWFGPKYPLLRGNVVQLRRAPQQKKPHHVVIALGGGDAGPLAVTLANHLQQARLRLSILAGWGESQQPSLPRGVEWQRATPHALTLLSSADVLVCAGGVTMWEGFCLGRTVVVLPRSAEQERNARRQDTFAFTAPAGDVSTAAALVQECVRVPALAYQRARAAYETVDGHGLDRLEEWLVSLHGRT